MWGAEYGSILDNVEVAFRHLASSHCYTCWSAPEKFCAHFVHIWRNRY